MTSFRIKLKDLLKRAEFKDYVYIKISECSILKIKIIKNIFKLQSFII